MSTLPLSSTTPETMYNAEERAEQIRKMKEAAEKIYWMCANTGVHAFIEFNGLIAKFIDVCQRAHEAGFDYNTCNTHTGQPLPMVQPHDVHYMAEKLGCIFGPTLDDPHIRKAFLKALFPDSDIMIILRTTPEPGLAPKGIVLSPKVNT
jgi:hypothetical protein